MKKICAAVIFIFSLTGLRLLAQETDDLETFENAMRPGAEITYDVTANGKSYKLIVTLKSVGDQISYSWKTTDPDNKSGSVAMSSEALIQAMAFANTFAGGAVKLDKETCLWLSKQAFTDINNDAHGSFKVNGASDTVTIMNNMVDNTGFDVNGTIVGIEAWELQGGNPKYTIGVLESAKFPLVYKLDIGWSMVLSGIKNP